VGVVTLHLRIDVLVLDGFGAGMEREIRAAMESALAELFRVEGPRPGSLRDRPQVATRPCRIETASTARVIGEQLARTVHRGIVA
jgi:hypothetical protein